jgi:NAD(P)-dependent dehydrogenase (short-subunit alcohol dehydrogenase family)
MILLKILILQAFWFGAVHFSDHKNSFLFWIIALLLILFNYIIYKVDVSKVRYGLLALLFCFWGQLQDGLLEWSDAIKFVNSTLWLNSLWLVFLIYYGDVFNKFTKVNIKIQALIGGVAGVFTYWSGCRLANISIENEITFIFIVFVSWLIFFPFSLYLFYKNDFWNWLLDHSVYFSFDSSGFKRHAESFRLGENKSLENKQILVTGGTGGIGLSTCEELTLLGAKVIFTGRNEQKGKQYSKSNREFVSLDMSNWTDIETFTKSCHSFDGIVLNAGGMPPEKELNAPGVELQAASQLFGHFYLIDLLHSKGKLNKGCRITWVSSGGMYLKKLDLGELIDPSKYDKVDVYANVKRAQITLVEELVKEDRWSNFNITTMHPGWVATDGVKSAIPGFYKFTKGRLRIPKQGADTIVWIQSTDQKIDSGSFYFDRKKVSPYISKSYIPGQKDREELVRLIQIFRIGAFNE